MWPPDAVKQIYGNGTLCSMPVENAWPSRWLMPISFLLPLPVQARDFAKQTPTNKDPGSPGLLVTAMTSTSSKLICAFSSACSTMGLIFSSCERDASSGTTPPKFLCSSICEYSALESKPCVLW